MSGFTKRLFILLLALFEGNKDDYIIMRVGNYLSADILYKRIEFIYWEVIRRNRKELIRQLKKEKDD
jgi:hypothetical protein